MKEKAIKDLMQLSDDDLFEQVAIGLELLFENAEKISEDAQVLADQKRLRGSRILASVAEEEAAKFLILLDAIRCPRSTEEEKQTLSRHLRTYYDHLARGIYVEYSTLSLGTFGEGRGWVEGERADYYLDGEEITWIFRNQILQQREDAIYVDYIDSDEGHYWTSPKHEIDLVSFSRGPSDSWVLELMSALYDVGVATEDGLRVIASIWRPVEMTDDLHVSQLREINRRTLESLSQPQSNDSGATVLRQWSFPLYSLDLSPRRVKRGDLRKRQEEEKEAFWRQMV